MSDNLENQDPQQFPPPPISRPAGGGLSETGPDLLSATTSLGEIISASPNAAVHILFVHGIRAGDRGVSKTFRTNLMQRLPPSLGTETTPTKTTWAHRLNVGPWPHITYMGKEVWPTQTAWDMGPFVDRFEYARADGDGAIVIDEINWWPLALPLRCIALLQPEAYLAGPDLEDLNTCAAVGKDGEPLNDGIHYPFLSRADLGTLKAAKLAGSVAAWANGYVKRTLMDWGLSDAIIALGPMQKYLHLAINGAFDYAAQRDRQQGKATTFIVVSESLGSFIVMDAYSASLPAVQAVLDETAYIYFFANQFALLELGRLTDPSQTTTAPASATDAVAVHAPHVSLHKALQRWAEHNNTRPIAETKLSYKQIIAFSDPSDALTFRVPAIEGVAVVNVYDRNGFDFLRIFAEPVAAHTGHSSNRHVLDLMLGRQA